VLTVTPDRWKDLSQALPFDLLQRRPAPGEWSAVECFQHILDAERVIQFRLECFQNGADLPGFNPDEEGSRIITSSPTDLAGELAHLRAESLEMIAAIRDSDLDLRVRHQELGPVTLGEMLSEWAAHDLNHTIQAEGALMQPFLVDCGPWIRYFGDHRIKEK
jgi:hypothetical protein